MANHQQHHGDHGDRPKRSHKFRNFVVFPVGGLLALVVVGSALGGEGGEGQRPTDPVAPPTAPAPAPAPVENTTPVPLSPAPSPAPVSTLEVFGDGEAMVTVMTSGTSTNTVGLPHAEKLPEGYALVSVTRSPSVESFMENGAPDSGEVGCRITRDGEVVEEQKASGQYASVSCSKYY